MAFRGGVMERAAHAQEKAKEMLDDAPSMVSRARSLVSGDAHFFTAQPRLDQIRKQLEEESVNTKKDAMKRIIAQICLGQDMAPLFPDVVKNVLIPSIELRKLIYFYIVHYCEARPNESLLSISAFQKDLMDPSMHIRALALRVLASIRLPAIHPVVMLAIKKCATDPAGIVRKTAAVAIVKAFVITKGQESLDTMVQIVGQLLGDRSAEVVGAAALAFLEVCPERFDVVHRHFRKICRSLIDTDEWSQCIVLQLLLRYSRSQFVDPKTLDGKVAPKKPAAKKETKPKDSDDSDSDDSSSSEEDVVKDPNGPIDLDADHRMLLQAVKPLFFSMNKAVIVACASLYYHCAPEGELDICVRPLLRVLGSGNVGCYQHVGLINIYPFVLKRPVAFQPYIKEFYLQPGDTAPIRECKLRALSRLATKDNVTAVLADLRSVLYHWDVNITVDTIRGLGWIASQLPDSHVGIMRLIMPLLTHDNDEVVTESVVVLRHLVTMCQDKAQTSKIVLRLVQSVLKGEMRSSLARASIVWLVGDNIRAHPNIAKVAPDFFRVCLKTFATEDTAVKRVILMLGFKLWLLLDGEGASAQRFKGLFMHLLELVKYDNSYDIRDQGRMVNATLDRSGTGFKAARAAVMGDKPPAVVSDPLAERVRFQLGSLSYCVGATVLNYDELKPWPLEAPDPTVRDPPEAANDASEDYSDTTTTSSSSDDSDSESESSSDSSESDSEEEAAKSGSTKKKGDDDSDSSDDEGAKGAPLAAQKPQPKAAPAPVKMKIVTRVVTAPKAAPAKDRIITELFNSFGSKPATAAATGKHSDPFQKMFGAHESEAAVAPALTVVAQGPVLKVAAGHDASGAVALEFTNVSDEAAENVHLERYDGLEVALPLIGTIEAGATQKFAGKAVGPVSDIVLGVFDGKETHEVRPFPAAAAAGAEEAPVEKPAAEEGAAEAEEKAEDADE